MAEGWALEYQAPARMDGTEEDVLDRQRALAAEVAYAPALVLADLDPLGGAMASAMEALDFARDFEQGSGTAN